MTRKETEPLPDPYRVLNAFRNLVKALRLADRAGLKKHGLGSSQIYILHALGRESQLSVNELAQRTGTDQSTVSVVVNKLVEKGFVASNRAESDGRRVELSLTPKGRQVLRNLPPPVQESIVAGVSRLPPARARVLADTLQEIVRGLGIDDEHPPMMFEEDGRSKPTGGRARKRATAAKQR